MENKLIVGTDFSGIGSPEQALEELQNESFLKFTTEFACEIDKYARKSYEAIHGKPKYFFEDATKRDNSIPRRLGLYIAGFPCQAFSIAGQRKGFEDVRGTLFFNVADFIRINQPECFILENVKGLLSHDSGRTFQTIIDLLSNCGGTVNGQMSLDFFEDGLGYHVYHQVLNTKEHGLPQNRERIFIIGFKNYRDYRFPMHEPLKLKLKDILEEEVDEKYFLSDKALKGLLKYNQRQIDKGTTGFSAKFRDVEETEIMDTIKIGGSGKDDLIKVNSATKKGYEEAKEGDSINFSVPGSKTRRGRVGKEVAQTLDTACNQAIVSDKIRRLTPLECWRLQGFTDEQFYKAQKVNSGTQLYKQAGNSISVNVIKKIIKNIYND